MLVGLVWGELLDLFRWTVWINVVFNRMHGEDDLLGARPVRWIRGL
jgi:hypothetical protein